MQMSAHLNLRRLLAIIHVFAKIGVMQINLFVGCFFRCVEEDISLAHSLLDYGVVVTGDCFINFVKSGHVDLVDRY